MVPHWCFFQTLAGRIINNSTVQCPILLEFCKVKVKVNVDLYSASSWTHL